MIKFHVLPRGSSPPQAARNAAYLRVDFWNDYSYVTMFDVFAFDEEGRRHDLNNVKIGFVGQTTEISTYTKIDPVFDKLPEIFFSVGVDVSYYKMLSDEFSDEFRSYFLDAMRDVVADQNAFLRAVDEKVFATSHLRTININTIENQFRRVLAGGVTLTDYNFRFTLDANKRRAGFQLDFKVDAESKPSTNIHAIIGRNGIGKTTFLNSMIESVASPKYDEARFEQWEGWSEYTQISKAYFSGIISISFSAFDPFNPPAEQSDPTNGFRYYYVGLKDRNDPTGAALRPISALYADFLSSLSVCLSEVGRRKRWLAAIQMLESDENFAAMQLGNLADPDHPSRSQAVDKLSRRMSSGHAIVLLTITKLVASLEEKTLVLFDEPESHLHPPLLSALVRSLSMLLHDRNGVAIIATHSPVVLQEVPRSCAWKLTRAGVASSWARPDVETFGENVGVLTRDVFGLEVQKSGFNALLTAESAKSPTYEAALAAFGGQVGIEGRAILRSLYHEQKKL